MNPSRSRMGHTHGFFKTLSSRPCLLRRVLRCILLGREGSLPGFLPRDQTATSFERCVSLKHLIETTHLDRRQQQRRWTVWRDFWKPDSGDGSSPDEDAPLVGSGWCGFWQASPRGSGLHSSSVLRRPVWRRLACVPHTTSGTPLPNATWSMHFDTVRQSFLYLQFSISFFSST